MPLECNACKAKVRTVFYRSYRHYPRQVRNLWWLVLLAAGITLYNAVRFLVDLFDFHQLAQAVRDEIIFSGLDSVPGVADAGDLVMRLANLLLWLTVAVIVYLPLRYGFILARFRRGKPTTYWQIRNTALLTIAVSVFSYFLVVYLMASLQTLDVGPRIGLNIAVAPVILLQMQRREVKEYFSQFNWEALPPSEPKALTFIPEAEPAATEWQRLD